MASGAEIVTANTFRTHARTLAKAGLEARAGELSALAVRLAHQGASVPGRDVFVAGSLSPLEDCYRPDLVPEQAAVEREHAAQARFLAESGVDLILAETHNSIREAVAATRAAKATGLPTVVSLVTDGSGRLLSGESLGDAAAALLPLAPDAIGINCVPAARLAGDLAMLAAAAPGVPLVAYGNLGLPADGPGWSFTEELAPRGLRRGGRPLDRARRPHRRRLLRNDGRAHAGARGGLQSPGHVWRRAPARARVSDPASRSSASRFVKRQRSQPIPEISA